VNTKRHAKPTRAMSVERLYRAQLRMDAKLTQHMKTLADEFTRVLRQNDTLRGEVDTLKGIIEARERKSLIGLKGHQLAMMIEANRYMAAAGSPFVTGNPL
jgi:hypothetical protein